MLAYAALIPSSPLLLQPRAVGKPLRDALSRLNDGIQKHNIHHCIILAGASSVDRAGVSASVSPRLEISFQEFGDLSPHEQATCWFDGFLKLRESFTFPVELLDQPQLDYRHAIPYHLLKTRLPAGYELKILSLAIPDLDAQSFSSLVAALADVCHLAPTAVICQADLAATARKSTPTMLEEVNNTLRKQIALGSTHLELPDNRLIAPECLTSYRVLQGLVEDDLHYHEILWSTLPTTHLLIAEYDTAN